MDSSPRRGACAARILLVSLLGCLAACVSSSPTRTSEPILSLAPIALPPDLDRVLRDYESAWQARDADALASLFSADGFVLSNHSPPIRGRVAIRERYTGSGGPLWLSASSFATQGSVGWIVGIYGHAPGTPASGKFVLALVRSEGGPWLIAADIENGNQRPGAPPPKPEGTP